ISVDLKLDTLCLSLFYCQQDLSVYFISIIGASGDTDDSAFVVLWDNHHVVTSRPMDSAIMEQPASLITQCQLYSETIQHPNIRRTLITTNTTAMSRLFLLDRFFHGMWLVSICGAASSVCTSSMACGWVGIMVWICACSPPSSLPSPSSIPSVSGQPSCGNFKAYGFCNYGASCKFDHPVPVNPYHYAGLTMPSMPTTYGSGFGSVLVLLLLQFLVQVTFLVFQFQSVVLHPPTALLPWHVAGTNGASGDTADSAFVVLRDNHHVVTSRSMDSAIMEQAANMITQCKLYSETIQHPNIRRTLITTNTTAMSRLFLLDRFFHGMWLVSICGAASSDCTSSMACGWVGIMVWICACSPPSSLPCPSSIPSVSVSICGAASSGYTSSTNTHISCSVLHLFQLNTNGASGDTDDSAFVVLRDNHHVVTSRPMDSAIMEQAASLITQCQLYSETIQHPNIRRTLITTNTTAMSRPFLLDRFFHGMWLVSICGAASSDCTSSMACGWFQSVVLPPPAALLLPILIFLVVCSTCFNSMDLKLDTLCLSLFYCQQDLSVYFISINGASGDTDDSAFVVLRDNQHVLTSRPMDSAIMEQAASFTMLYMPTAYAPPVSTQVRITSPPSLSDSTTVSNGDKSAAENKSSETEKQDEIAGLITKPL
ncbi:hypothetical protein IGI04_012003, partial [Brassica rapa subsp. trilocularis]